MITDTISYLTNYENTKNAKNAKNAKNTYIDINTIGYLESNINDDDLRYKYNNINNITGGNSIINSKSGEKLKFGEKLEKLNKNADKIVETTDKLTDTALKLTDAGTKIGTAFAGLYTALKKSVNVSDNNNTPSNTATNANANVSSMTTSTLFNETELEKHISSDPKNKEDILANIRFLQEQLDEKDKMISYLKRKIALEINQNTSTNIDSDCSNKLAELSKQKNKEFANKMDSIHMMNKRIDGLINIYRK